MPRSCSARSRGASSGASRHSPTETAPGEQTRPAVWAEGLSRTSHTSSPNSTLSPVPVRHREQDGLSPPLQCPTDQKVVAEELGQLHADDVFIQGQQVEGPFIAGDICVWDRDRGHLRSPGQEEPQESQQPQNRACGAPDRMGGRTLSPLLRQKRGANAVAGTHLPTSQQPASREPVFPAHLPVPAHAGIPALGFNWDPAVSATPSQQCSSTHHQRPPLPPAPSRKHRTGREGEMLRARQALSRKSSGRAQLLPQCHNTWVYLNISGLETKNFSCL